MGQVVETQAEENFLRSEILSLSNTLPFLPLSHLCSPLSSDGGFTIS